MIDVSSFVSRSGTFRSCYPVFSLVIMSDSYFPSLDPRLDGWPLMSSPVPTIVMAALYLLFVLIGPQVMKHREPLNVKVPMLIYNLLMVIASYYMFHEVWKCFSMSEQI